MDRAIAIRWLGLLLPLLLTIAFWLRSHHDRRETAAVLLATLWNLPALLAVHLLAEHFGWWSYDAQGGLFLGMPVDLYIGWALLWGALPVLATPSLPLWGVLLLFAALDLLLMPLCAPVLQLGESWLVGEAVLLAVTLLPAQLLGRWTLRRSRLPWRALLQAMLFIGMMLFLIPSIVLERTGTNWQPLLIRSWPINSLLLQLLALPALVGIAALQEFVVRGKGTPLPYDPPIRLVRSGVYSYVANPMQLSMAILLTGWGAILESPWVALAGVMSIVYGIGVAAHDERHDLVGRWGGDWAHYRKAVRNWIPRWRPWVPESSRLYVDAACSICSGTGAWIARRRPVGLEIVPASSHDGRGLRRMRYEPGTRGDMGEGEDGVAAFARALEHVNFAWAMIGWTIRLPLVRPLVQLVVDAVGGDERVGGVRET